MSQFTEDNNINIDYETLKTSVKENKPEKCYVFHGEERYLLERTLESVRTLLCPEGLAGFNYKRFEGKELTVEEIENAVDTFPVFAEKTLIEIHDFDIFNKNVNLQMLNLLSDLPEYVCILFIFGIDEYNPDGRLKTVKDILNHINVVEFAAIQDKDVLLKWIKRHFRDAGKHISSDDAEYLAFITGGYMALMNGEIEKTAAYAKADYVTRQDIDAVVTPALDTVVYKLSDALVNRDNKKALRILDELYQMREAPHKLMFNISMKMRQLLAARVCTEAGQNKTVLTKMCGIKHDFQAQFLMNTAKKTTLKQCKEAVIRCSETALELNNTSDPEARITELVAKLAMKQ